MTRRAASGGGRHVLVASPADFYREMLSGLLERHGHSVAAAADGAQLLETIARGPRPALLLLDTALGGPDCQRLLARLADDGPIPSLLLGGEFVEQSEFEPYRRLGARGWVAKSAPIDELLLAVQAVLFPQDQNIRRAPRAQLRIPVSWEHEQRSHHSHSFNLSADGMFVVTTSTPPAPPGTRIGLTFWVPGADSLLECDGVVIWSNARRARINELYPPGMGVMFEGLAAEASALIAIYVLAHGLGQG